MQKNLYAVPVNADVALVPLCGGNLQGGMESCVTIGQLPGVDDAFLIGDNKPGSPDIALRYTGDELDKFATRWVADRGLL